MNKHCISDGTGWKFCRLEIDWNMHIIRSTFIVPARARHREGFSVVMSPFLVGRHNVIADDQVAIKIYNRFWPGCLPAVACILTCVARCTPSGHCFPLPCHVA
eukprot:364283-Chlamydomonas_euryale.AAC.28